MTGDAYARLGAPAGASVSADVADVESKVDDLEGRLTATRAGYLDNLSAGAVAQASALATVAGYVDTEVAAVLAAVDTEVAAIKAKTDSLPSDPADQSAVEAAITAAHSTTNGKIDAVDNFVDTEVGAIKAVTDKLDTAMELDGAVYRLTTNALEQAPTGGSAPTAAAIADAVLDEAMSGHTTAGTLGKAVADTLADTAELQTNQGNWATATGFSTHSAADVKTAIEAAGSHLTLIKAVTDAQGGTGTGLTAVPWNAAWDAEVQSECADAITAADFATDAEVAAAVRDVSNTAPAASSLGAAVNSAASAGDPWATTLPGSYGAGTAGKIVGDNINAPIGTVDTVVDAIKAVTDNLPDSGALTSLPTASEIRTEMEESGSVLATTLYNTTFIASPTEIRTEMQQAGSHLALIKAKTDNLPTSPAAVGSAMTLHADYDAAKTAATQASVNTIDGIVDDILVDTGTTIPAAITALTESGIKKNTALSGFTFYMTDSTNHEKATGLTVTAERSLDGAAFAACANAVTELSDGCYSIDLAAADLNADVVVLKFTATDADDLLFTIKTSS